MKDETKIIGYKCLVTQGNMLCLQIPMLIFSENQQLFVTIN